MSRVQTNQTRLNGQQMAPKYAENVQPNTYSLINFQSQKPGFQVATNPGFGAVKMGYPDV